MWCSDGLESVNLVSVGQIVLAATLDSVFNTYPDGGVPNFYNINDFQYNVSKELPTLALYCSNKLRRLREKPYVTRCKFILNTQTLSQRYLYCLISKQTCSSLYIIQGLAPSFKFSVSSLLAQQTASLMNWVYLQIFRYPPYISTKCSVAAELKLGFLNSLA